MTAARLSKLSRMRTSRHPILGRLIGGRCRIIRQLARHPQTAPFAALFSRSRSLASSRPTVGRPEGAAVENRLTPHCAQTDAVMTIPVRHP
jgi:hypothetical protein